MLKLFASTSIGYGVPAVVLTLHTIIEYVVYDRKAAAFPIVLDLQFTHHFQQALPSDDNTKQWCVKRVEVNAEFHHQPSTSLTLKINSLCVWLVDELEKTAERGGGGGAAAAAHRNNDMYLSTDNLERLDKDNLKKSGVLGDEKLRNIITYLDEVDTAERLSQIDQVLAKSLSQID